MSTLFLHIGVARTGTTFLQDMLYANRHILAKQKFLFPILPAGIENALSGIDVFKGSRKHANILHERLERNKSYSVIISNEMIYKNIVSTGDINLLKFALEEFRKNIKIICYVRRQDEAIISGYPIDISRGSREPLELDASANQAKILDYHKQLKKWRQVFGAENVIIRRFGRAYFTDGRLEKDFADQIGIDISDFEILENTNKSFNSDAVEIVRRLNFNDSKLPLGTLNFLRSQIFTLGDKKAVGASREERTRFLSHFEQSNQLLAKQFLDISGPLFTHEIPDNGTSLTNDTVLPIMFSLLENLPLNVPEDTKSVHAKNLYFLAKQHVTAKEYHEARVLYEDIINHHAHENYRPVSELQWRLAACAMKLGDNEDALDILRNILTTEEVDERVLSNCSKVAELCGDNEMSEKFTLRAKSNNS